jgi:predicted small lipoprotein YifL
MCLASAFHPLQTFAPRDNLSPMRLALIPLLLALSACGATGPLPRTPDARLADEIEAKLRNVPCVGPMNRWERHYDYSGRRSLLAILLSFGTSNEWLNYRSVDIAYHQAGFEEFRAGRVLGHHRPPMIDDRQYNSVAGHYDIPTHTAFLWWCGPNMGGAEQNIVVR